MAEKFSVAIRSDAYKTLINNTLGDPEVARKFIADISSVVSQNAQLQLCEPGTIVSAGLMAQALNLPLSPTLGFAYVVPYNGKGGNKAQFQIGYKGLIQLAQRSGQFQRLGVRSVHEGEYTGQDEFGDDVFKFSHEFDAAPVVGYYAYFVLNNGFKKTLYMTKEQATAHGKRYSRAFASGWSGNLWKDQFDLMAEKTVLKLLLNRYAPLSVEMQKAVQADQAVIGSDGSYTYVDNEPEEAPARSTVKTTIIPEQPVKEITPQPDSDGVFTEEDAERLF